MKGDSYGRRYTEHKPVSARFLADEHAPVLTDHDRHLRLVLAASPRGFTWLVRGTK
jgi:hypothetical protein